MAQTNKYQQILNQINPSNHQTFLQDSRLSSDIEYYRKIKLTNHQTSDIFRQAIQQIQNGQFQKLVQKLDKDNHFLQKYVKFTENNYSEYVNIAHGDDGVNFDRFRQITILLIISCFEHNFSIESNIGDFKVFLKAHAQLEELQHKVASKLSASYEHSNLQFFGDSDLVSLVKIEIPGILSRYARFGFKSTDLDKDSLLNLVRYYNWLEDLRDFLNLHYREFDLWNQDKILMLISSIGEPGFSKSLAMGPEDLDSYSNQDPEYPNKDQKYCSTCEKFWKFLNVVCERPQTVQLNYSLSNLPDRIFQFNICQSIWSDKTRSAILSIHLLNLLISESRNHGTNLALLDMRLPEHVHLSNANRCLSQDRVAIDEYRKQQQSDKKMLGKSYEKMIRSNELFRLKGIELFESPDKGGLIRLGHFWNKYYSDFDYQFVIFALKALYDRGNGFPIDKFYV